MDQTQTAGAYKLRNIIRNDQHSYVILIKTSVGVNWKSIQELPEKEVIDRFMILWHDAQGICSVKVNITQWNWLFYKAFHMRQYGFFYVGKNNIRVELSYKKSK